MNRMTNEPILGDEIQTIVAKLRLAAIFAGLDDHVLGRLAGCATPVTVEARTRLFSQNDADLPCHILLDGQIALSRTSQDNTVTVVDVIRPSGQVGLSASLTNLPALTHAETVTRSELVLIEGAGLRALLPEEPTLATALLRAEATDFRALVLQVCDLKMRTTAQRLGCYLLELAPDPGSRSATIRLPFDKRLLAARLGCRQENLSRAFATLRAQGVETRGARVTLHDMAKLRFYSVAETAAD